MPHISKKEYLTRYKRKIAMSKAWREDEGYDQLWELVKDLYRGKQFSNELSNEDKIAVNISFSTVNVIFPSISINYPKFTVQPNREEDTSRAVIVEATVNYWWRRWDFQDAFRQAAKDYVIFGHGWLKIAWRYKEAEVPFDDLTADDEYADMVAEADEFAAANPHLAGDVPSDEDIEQEVFAETRLVAVDDRPLVERVSPHDMFVDPEATSVQDMTWIAQRVVRPIDEVRSDDRYRAAARKKLKPDVKAKFADDSEHRARFGRHSEDAVVDRVTIWEFYDLKLNTMSVCCDSIDEFLVDPTPIPFAFGHPYIMFRNYEVPDCFYPIGDLEQLECLQAELNKTRSQMMNHRKKFARKYLYRENAFGPAGRDALESDQDNRLVPVIDNQTPLSDLVVPMPITQLPPEMYSHSQIIEDDIDTVSGVNEYARGGAPNIRRTATEAAIIQDAINSRSADKLAQVEMVLSKTARHLVQVMQQFLTGDQIARVNGNDGTYVWVPYDRESIKGEFDFAVEAGSTQPTNEMFRRQQALSMMTAMGPYIGTVVNPFELVKHALQFGFGIKNPSKFLVPGADMQMWQQGMDPQGGMGMPGTGQPLPSQPFQEEPEDGTEPNPLDATANQLAGQVGLGI